MWYRLSIHRRSVSCESENNCCCYLFQLWHIWNDDGACVRIRVCTQSIWASSFTFTHWHDHSLWHSCVHLLVSWCIIINDVRFCNAYRIHYEKKRNATTNALSCDEVLNIGTLWNFVVFLEFHAPNSIDDCFVFLSIILSLMYQCRWCWCCYRRWWCCSFVALFKIEHGRKINKGAPIITSSTAM